MRFSNRYGWRGLVLLCAVALVGCDGSSSDGFVPGTDTGGGGGAPDAVGADGTTGRDTGPRDVWRAPDTGHRDVWQAPDATADTAPDVSWQPDTQPRDIPPRDVPPRDVPPGDIPDVFVPPPDVPADVVPDVSDVPSPEDVSPDVPHVPDVPIPADVPPPEDTGPDVQTDPGLTVTLHALDLWGQALPPPSEGTFLVVRDDATGAVLPLDRDAWPAVTFALPEAGAAEVELSHPDHYDATVLVRWNGSRTSRTAVTASLVDPPDPAWRSGLVVSHEADGAGWRHTVHVGLRHRWFAPSGPPARRGNHVRLLMDGEEAWRAVWERLSDAQWSILLSTWWWESRFELIRELPQHLSLTPEARFENTIFMTLWRTPATIRTLVGQFWGQDSILSWLTTDSDLEAVADDPDDGWEFMGQGNPTRGVFEFSVAAFRFGDRVKARWPETETESFDAELWIPSSVPSRTVDLTDFPFGFETDLASYHQKFMVIDFETAFIGGMNLRRTDWDTSDHEVFDPRRLPFDATADDRYAVYLREEVPSRGPRKDYMVRVDGPSVADAAAVFQDRWDLALESGVEFSENSTAFSVPSPPAPYTDGVQAQVSVTLPEPFRRAEILESWWNAIANAEDYIFIEDQYWRIPVLMDAIIARMQAVPGLRLLVVTKPVSEWSDPGCRWTHEMHGALKTLFPDRYRTFQLRSFDYETTCALCIDETEAFFVDIDVHSKLLIVDDRFLSVGSCNKNNRGVTYEGEMNLEVLDSDFVRAARRRITENMLGYALPMGSTFDDTWIAFDDEADWNDWIYGKWDAEGFDRNLNGVAPSDDWIPTGFVYGLDFRDVANCLIEDIGPDIAK